MANKFVWNDDGTITITPPSEPKKVTGTRLAAIMGLNRWTTPFNAWCAITRTYEEPFEDTIYTIAGKTIEPKQYEFMKTRYFYRKTVSPTDVYGEDYFHKTWGDFFPSDPVLGGMWDYLFVDKDGHAEAVMEMKTTKRAEDWVDGIPEYYAIQAALYAYLLGVDDVYMVCTLLDDEDYEKPEEFVCTGMNTFVRMFKVSERYPRFAETVAKVRQWWIDHVVNGMSPAYDEKADADILKALRTACPDTKGGDIEALLDEADSLEEELERISEAAAPLEKRLKEIKDALKKHAMPRFGEGYATVSYPTGKNEWTVSAVKSLKIDEAAMKKDGVLEKYKTKEAVSYRITAKKLKGDDSADSADRKE